jgi:hypothetical protein
MNYRLSIIFCLLFTPPALAISIDIDFQPGNSDNPAFDPNANGLIGLFDFAADYYGQIFEDTHNITINVWYEDLDGPAGNTQFFGNNPLSAADIRIDSTTSWFIDPTPEDNDEFDMEQKLWSGIARCNPSRNGTRTRGERDKWNRG